MQLHLQWCSAENKYSESSEDKRKGGLFNNYVTLKLRNILNMAKKVSSRVKYTYVYSVRQMMYQNFIVETDGSNDLLCLAS